MKNRPGPSTAPITPLLMRLMRLTRPMLVMLFVSAIFAGCAGLPDQAEPAPDWVRNPPQSEGDYEFFVGFGIAETPGEARQLATSDMVSDITRYLGVRITAESTAAARGSIDELETSIRSQVTQESDVQVSGFRVIDSWINEEDGEVQIYLLGRYDRNELEAERRRI